MRGSASHTSHSPARLPARREKTAARKAEIFLTDSACGKGAVESVHEPEEWHAATRAGRPVPAIAAVHRTGAFRAEKGNRPEDCQREGGAQEAPHALIF